MTWKILVLIAVGLLVGPTVDATDVDVSWSAVNVYALEGDDITLTEGTVSGDLGVFQNVTVGAIFPLSNVTMVASGFTDGFTNGVYSTITGSGFIDFTSLSSADISVEEIDDGASGAAPACPSGTCAIAIVNRGTGHNTIGIVAGDWAEGGGSYFYDSVTTITLTFTPVTLPAISMFKSASIWSYSAAGTLVTYSYHVFNSGDVTLNPVTVTDPMSGLSSVSCPNGTLAAQESEICTATYTTTQADVDAGLISNTGTASGTPPSGPAVTASSTLTIPAVQMPNIAIALSAMPTIFSAPGTVVTYSYLVTNSGNVDLSAVSVNDTMTGLSTISCPGTSLAPAASETCTATYTTTQADVDVGSISNSATASGTPPIGSAVTSSASTVSIPASDTPAIGVVKSANITSYSAAATVITYSYLVTNTGNVDLNPVTVTDPMAGLSTISCPVTSLAPAASEICTATYTTTATDVTNGWITNTGTATGTPETGSKATATSTLTIPYEVFTISDSPTAVSVVQGSSGTSTITTTVSGAFNSAIALSASGQPTGVTVSFNPNSIPAPGSGSSTMAFAVGSTTAPGTYTITVTGAGGGITQTATVSLTVTAAAPPSFTISDSPTAVSVVQGSSGTSTITTTVSGAFNSAIALSASGQPTGVTVSFNPNSIPAPGSGSSTMTFAVGSTTAPGTYTITVTGTGGGITQTATVSLTVTALAVQLSVTPSAIAFGAVIQYSLELKTVTVKNTGGGAVSITNVSVKPVQGSPDEFYTVSLCPSSLAAGKSCTIAVALLASTVGSPKATLTITDTAAGSPQQVALSATVTKIWH